MPKISMRLTMFAMRISPESGMGNCGEAGKNNEIQLMNTERKSDCTYAFFVVVH